MSDRVTTRLRLRRWRDDDLDAYARVCADPEVMRYLGGTPFTRDQSEQQMRAFMEHWSERGFGLWAVDHLDDDQFIGFIGLSTHTWFPGVEVGWRLDRAYWGRGQRSAPSSGDDTRNVRPQTLEGRGVGAGRLGAGAVPSLTLDLE